MLNLLKNNYINPRSCAFVGSILKQRLLSTTECIHKSENITEDAQRIGGLPTDLVHQQKIKKTTRWDNKNLNGNNIKKAIGKYKYLFYKNEH